MPTLTVFTPLYNRKDTLKRTYESLCRQTCKDFEWLIIDDGSTDNPYKEIEEWIQRDNGFMIRYIYKENGGMHTAHNTAYENIYTELNTCVDSDDALTENAVEIIIRKWNKVREKNYAGIIALDRDMNTGVIIGDSFEKNLTETTLSGYYGAGGKGDKKLIYRTDIITKYPPYPVFENEKYVALAYKYRLIDQEYKLAVLNEVVCEVEYQPDGSTGTMLKQYLENPNGFIFWRTICMEYPTSTRRCFIDCVHYVTDNLIAKKKGYLKKSPRKIMTFFAQPFGLIMYLYVRKKA